MLFDFIDNSKQDFVLMDKDLLRGLSEKEVEIEHLKTNLVSLNQRLEVNLDINALDCQRFRLRCLE